MQFLEQLYLSDNISEKEERVRSSLRKKKPAGDWFIITISTMRDGMLDILPAMLIRQKWYETGSLQVLGVAKGYFHALSLMEKMTLDVYKSTGKCRLKEYFLTGMEKDKE